MSETKQLEKLIEGLKVNYKTIINTAEGKRVLADLEKRKLELLKMEDDLRALELDLSAKKIDLENMSIELQKREKRVNELEEIIANKA